MSNYIILAIYVEAAIFGQSLHNLMELPNSNYLPDSEILTQDYPEIETALKIS